MSDCQVDDLTYWAAWMLVPGRIIMAAMSEALENRRRFFAVSVLLVVVASGVLAFWIYGEWNVVRQRQWLATFLEEHGGRIIYVDEAHRELQLPLQRRLLGDKAIHEVELPYAYGVDPQFRRTTKGIFPEVSTYSVLRGDVLVEELFGGKDAVEIVEHPDRVEVFRLNGERKRRPVKDAVKEAQLDDFPPVSDAVPVPHDIALQVAATLISPESYHWLIGKLCIPEYDVRFSFFRGDQRVDVLFYFECDMLLILRNGQGISGGYFDYSHNFLASIMKQLFPKDEEIQAIPSRPARRK